MIKPPFYSGAESNIGTSLDKVKARIATACRHCNRDPAEITLLAVSKTKPAEMIIDALQHYQFHFGENYLQDALQKMPMIGNSATIWHFIGAIQSNKTRAIAEHFDWVHTVASKKVATRLNDQRTPESRRLNVLLQVNIDNESTKDGLLPQAVSEFIESIQTLDRIQLRGLMAIPAPGKNPDMQREAFQRLRQLKQTINENFGLKQFDQLSMGMSADLEVAVEEGSTILRIGTAIFGPRSK